MDVTSGVPGVNAPDPETYEEFWPYYVSQHLHPATRAIHVGATSAAGVVGAAGIVSLNPLLVAVAPVIGYGPARVDRRCLGGRLTGIGPAGRALAGRVVVRGGRIAVARADGGRRRRHRPRALPARGPAGRGLAGGRGHPRRRRRRGAGPPATP